MRRLAHFPPFLALCLTLLGTTLFASRPASAQTFTFETLFNFVGADPGFTPGGNLTPDNQGNLYGTTASGGLYEAGTIFRYTPSTGQLTTLYNFTGVSPGDEGTPNPTLLFDGNHTLYGTTVGSSKNGTTGTLFKYDLS